MKNINSIISNSFRKVFILALSCLLAVPMTTAYAKDNAAILKDENSRKKGELIRAGEITLNDAALALEAALGITALEGEQFWAADLLDEGAVSLENAQSILNAALGIEDIEVTLLKNEDYLVKNYLSIEVKTDQEAYHPGDQIKMTIFTKNTAPVPIYAVASTTTFGFSGCVDCKLVDEGATELDWKWTSRQDRPLTGEIYFGTLMPQETKETALEMTLPGELSKSHTYFLKISFGYTDEFCSFPRKIHYVKVPIDIEY